MPIVKDTLRAAVRVGYDGRVYKQFRGPKAEERFANEVKVLRYLEARACPFVPRLLEAEEAELRIVPDAGHSAFEPGIVHELISVTDQFAANRTDR